MHLLCMKRLRFSHRKGIENYALHNFIYAHTHAYLYSISIDMHMLCNTHTLSLFLQKRFHPSPVTVYSVSYNSTRKTSTGTTSTKSGEKCYEYIHVQ